jgi:hypothetical protein
MTFFLGNPGSDQILDHPQFCHGLLYLHLLNGHSSGALSVDKSVIFCFIARLDTAGSIYTELLKSINPDRRRLLQSILIHTILTKTLHSKIAVNPPHCCLPGLTGCYSEMSINS